MDEEENNLSLDEVLESERNAYSMSIGDNPLPQDNDTPAATAASPSGKTLPEDHQSTDSNLDSSEIYEAGYADTALDDEEDEEFLNSLT